MKTLRQFLKDRGQAQKDFAAMVNVSPSHLSEIINGTKTPSLEMAVRIARATRGAVREYALLPEDTLRANGWLPVQKGSSDE